MTTDLAEGLVNALNLNNFYSDKINTNFTVKNGQIVSSFEGNPDVNKYTHEVRNEIIKQSFGSEEIASKFFNLEFSPFSDDGVNLITPEVERNFKVHLAIAFQRFVENEIREKFINVDDERREMIIEFIRSLKVGRMGGDINDLYSIELENIKSANPQINEILKVDPKINETLKALYVKMFASELEHCGLDSSEFFERDGNRLYIKDIVDIKVVNNIAKYIAERIALNFSISDDIDSKLKNFKDVLRRKIFQLTETNEKEGIVVDGYDCDTFVDENKVSNGHNFALIPLVKVNGQFKTLSIEDARRVNKASREKGLGDILFDIRGQTENTRCVNDQVHAFSNKTLALIISELMQSPIAYNEASKYFEYAVDLGNLYLEKQPDAQHEVNSDAKKRNLSFSSADSLAAKRRQNTNDENDANPINGAPKNASQSSGRLENQNNNFLGVTIPPRSDSTGSRDSGTSSMSCSRAVSTDSIIDSNTANSVVKPLPPVEEASRSRENSLEHNPPAKSSPVAPEPGPSLKRGSESRSSVEKVVHSIVTAVKEISGSWEHKSSSEVGSPKVNKQSEKENKKSSPVAGPSTEMSGPEASSSKIKRKKAKSQKNFVERISDLIDKGCTIS